MKALLVGAGGMGKAWARNIKTSPEASVTGWVDLRPGVAEQAGRELEIDLTHAGSNLDEAINACSPDFVVDVTSPEGHHDVVTHALGRGLPVIGEKPMAASMSQARAMVEAAERAGKLYMVSQSRRYDSGLVAYRKLIQTKLGHLGILNADFYIGAHFGGFRDEMPSPLILDMAIHTFDEARFLSGADPVFVYAEEFNPAWSWYGGDACASALFEMTDGLRFNYRGSWCAEGLSTSWDGDWRAVGAAGSAEWLLNQTPRAEIVNKTQGFQSGLESMQEEPQPLAGGIAGSLAEFLESLRTGKTPQGECHDNIKSLAMVFAAIESSKRQQRVALHEI